MPRPFSWPIADHKPYQDDGYRNDQIVLKIIQWNDATKTLHITTFQSLENGYFPKDYAERV